MSSPPVVARLRSGRSAGRSGRVAGGEVHSCPSEAATAVAARMSWVSFVLAASRSRSAAPALPKNSSREGLRLRGAPAAFAVAPGLAAGVAVAAGVRGGVRGDEGTPAEKPLASRWRLGSGVLACAAAWAALTVKVAAQAAAEKSHEDVCRLGRVGLEGLGTGLALGLGLS